jgi:hypothetical protein
MNVTIDKTIAPVLGYVGVSQTLNYTSKHGKDSKYMHLLEIQLSTLQK